METPATRCHRRDMLPAWKHDPLLAAIGLDLTIPVPPILPSVLRSSGCRALDGMPPECLTLSGAWLENSLDDEHRDGRLNLFAVWTGIWRCPNPLYVLLSLPRSRRFLHYIVVVWTVNGALLAASRSIRDEVLHQQVLWPPEMTAVTGWYTARHAVLPAAASAVPGMDVDMSTSTYTYTHTHAYSGFHSFTLSLTDDHAFVQLPDGTQWARTRVTGAATPSWLCREGSSKQWRPQVRTDVLYTPVRTRDPTTPIVLRRSRHHMRSPPCVGASLPDSWTCHGFNFDDDQRGTTVSFCRACVKTALMLSLSRTFIPETTYRSPVVHIDNKTTKPPTIMVDYATHCRVPGYLCSGLRYAWLQAIFSHSRTTPRRRAVCRLCCVQ